MTTVDLPMGVYEWQNKFKVKLDIVKFKTDDITVHAINKVKSHCFSSAGTDVL